jgi:hypothetical protein
MGKRWQKEEKEYLQSKWGTVSISSIAKKLNRSVNAVKLKARRMNLGKFLEAGNYITVNQFMLAFSKTNFHSYNLTSWVENRGFPLKYKKIVNKRVRVVYIEEFWEWAEKNRTFINFSKLEKNILGIEAEWVKEQRQLDTAATGMYKTTPWTKAEDSQLIYYLKLFRFSYDDLSKMLRRTCGAIQRRICDLGVKERPLKADNHSNPWESEDIDRVVYGIKNGFSYELIAENVGRSSKAVRGKVYTLYKTECLDKARQAILIGEIGTPRGNTNIVC